MPLNEETNTRIASLIQSGDVVLFMKGNRAFPQCGFSARVVQVLDSMLPEYETVDVLADPEIREGIKEYSSWPTIPQLYVRGEFMGGCDIITEMFGTGELQEKLGIEVPEATAPEIRISDAAAERIREHAQRAPEGDLHLAIDARYQPQLGFGPRQPNDIAVEANGITLLMDPLTAQRANGLSMDLVPTPSGGMAFKIDNPNAPRNG